MNRPLTMDERMDLLRAECGILSGNPHQNMLIRRVRFEEFLILRVHSEFILAAIVACIHQLNQGFPETEEGQAQREEMRARYIRMLQMARQIFEASMSHKPFEAAQELEHARKQVSRPRVYVPPAAELGDLEDAARNGAGPPDTEPEPPPDVPHDPLPTPET